VLSRSHCALISPVITKASGKLPSVLGVKYSTVVSSVHGRQLLNSVAKSGSTMLDDTDAINVLMAVELNFRSEGGGRMDGNETKDGEDALESVERLATHVMRQSAKMARAGLTVFIDPER